VMVVATVMAFARWATAATSAAAAVSFGSNFGAHSGGSVAVILKGWCLLSDGSGIGHYDEAEPQNDEFHHC
jgi:hypothetical protein